MQYWTKNGSIPSTETDGTEGWQPAPEPPTDVPENHEVIWASGAWHILTPKPTEPGTWRWYIDQGWVRRAEKVLVEEIPITIPEVLTTSQVSNLTTAQLI
jgi:hypothetical protein